MNFKIVEKKNPLAVHGIFDNEARAKLHLSEQIPRMCAKGFFMDKTLTPDDFEVIRA